MLLSLAEEVGDDEEDEEEEEEDEEEDEESIESPEWDVLSREGLARAAVCDSAGDKMTSGGGGDGPRFTFMYLVLMLSMLLVSFGWLG